MNRLTKTDKGYLAFLWLVAVAMVVYELRYCDHFIGYMDGKQYYQYLPEFFIEKNFSFYVKFPLGTALCELPFFLVAHLLTLPASPEAVTGYGGLYEYAVGFAGIFYFCVGSLLLYHTLKRLFTERTAAFSGILLALGTPLVWYATKYASFSHIYTYAVGSFLLYLTVRLAEVGKESDEGERRCFCRKTHRLSFLLGMAAGWLFILRNVNALFILLYLLYDFGSFSEWTAHLKKVFSMERLPYHLCGGLLMVVPQSLYWKKTTGSFLLNTYAEEGFTYLFHPKIAEVLFSDAKGYFIFTPLMALAVVGFFYLHRTHAKPFRFGVPLLFFYMLFINSTWWCWWFGGVYSIRTFLDILPYLSLSMAALLECLGKWLAQAALPSYAKTAYKAFYLICIGWMVAVNLCFLLGAHAGIINETFSNWWELKNAMGVIQ